MTSGIYAITCTVSGDVYIGQSKNCVKRWAGHLGDLSTGIHPNQLLQSLYDRYGLESFTFQVTKVCDVGLLDKEEKTAIAKRKPSANKLNVLRPHEYVGIAALRVSKGICFTKAHRRAGISMDILYFWERHGYNRTKAFGITWARRYRLTAVYECSKEDIDRAMEETRLWDEQQQLAV